MSEQPNPPSRPIITSRINPGDLWEPTNIDEWVAQERLRTFLPIWTEQATDERRLRSHCAWMIFSLAAFQTVCGMAFIVAIGRQWLAIDVDFLKILYSALLSEVFGLFFVVARYLFKQPLQFSLSSVIDPPPARPRAPAKPKKQIAGADEADQGAMPK